MELIINVTTFRVILMCGFLQLALLFLDKDNIKTILKIYLNLHVTCYMAVLKSVIFKICILKNAT